MTTESISSPQLFDPESLDLAPATSGCGEAVDCEAHAWADDLDIDWPGDTWSFGSNSLDPTKTSWVPSDSKEVQQRLVAALDGLVSGMSVASAVLYLLDDATRELRPTAWSHRHEQSPVPRRLATALADLEALTGSAIVLDSPAMADVWKVPTKSDASICVPVSTRRHVHGTLWVFADKPRDFSDGELQLVEIAASRLAHEVELEEALCNRS